MLTFGASSCSISECERDRDCSRKPPGGDLFDYIELTFVAPVSLRVNACKRTYNVRGMTVANCALGEVADHLVISRGKSLAPVVCAFAVDGDGVPLAGHFPVTITSSGAAELELQIADDRCATIGGLTLGEATVTVAGGGLSAIVAVTVEP